jgi:Skp family chaperone for outer membrane proteins
MTRQAANLLAGALLAVASIGAGPQNAGQIGFIDLPRLIATHPLHRVLAQYDREIAALRSTQTVAAVRDPGAQAQAAAATLRATAADAQMRAQSIAARSAGEYREREPDALAALLASRDAGSREMTAYRDDLTHATAANLQLYENAIAQRNQRAFAARAQELREKELSLAFDLARRDADRRVVLTLKLENLHLDAQMRAQLTAELNAQNAARTRALDAMRRADAAELASYRNAMERSGANAVAQMAATLRSNAAANVALRAQVLQTEPNASEMLTELASQAARFRASYRAASDANALSAGLRAASGDLSQRFLKLSQTDQSSRRDTTAQIAALQAGRAALYRALAAQIVQTAQRLAQARGLRGIASTGTRPADSVDLTKAVASELRGF